MGLDKTGHYTLKGTLDKDIMYYWIYSGRGVGKSSTIWKHCIDDALKTNSMSFAIIRRRLEDIRSGDLIEAVNGSSHMLDWLTKRTKGEWTELTSYRRKIYLAKYDEKSGRLIRGLCIGQMFALSEHERYKSHQYDTINNIFYEEILTNGLYLYDEVTIFNNLISTIVRDRSNVKVFMLSNTISRVCPYYQEWGLTNVPKQEKGTLNDYHVISYNSKGEEVRQIIRVEYCDSSEENKSNSVFLGKSSKAILTGEWETKEYNHINYNEYESIYQLTMFSTPFQFNIELLFHKTTFQYVVFVYEGQKVFRRKIKSGLYDDIYTSDYLRASNKAERKIAELMELNQIAFSTNLCGEDFTQTIQNESNLLLLKDYT